MKELHIQNYAIIDELSISFGRMLNVITGETGAGKSIIMGALGLILGERADSAVLQSSAKKCIVEAIFLSAGNESLKQVFRENDLDEGEEIVIRREIAPGGKSRAFINDTPVTLAQVKAVGSLLVDLHQQFDTLELGDDDFQREVIDAVAENGNLLSEMKERFTEYHTAKSRLLQMQEQQQHANKELDYNRFLFEELEELDLKENELEELDAELKLLTNAETVKQQLGSVYMELKDTEDPIVQRLKSFYQKLSGLKQYHPDVENLAARTNAAMIELDDIADELERIDHSITFDNGRINEVNDRIAAGYKLLKKHSVTTTAGLLEIQAALSDKINKVLSLEDEINSLEKKVAEYSRQCTVVATKLTDRRKKQADVFADKVNKLFTQVGMPNAQLAVEINMAPLNATGCDEIIFLFDANKSGRFEPLRKVASGGELSRLMLCVKSLVAEKLQLPTLIFDEIDSGISGEAAKQVGTIMKGLSVNHQLIVISHQPQIAAKADEHHFVFKQFVKERVVTSVKNLNREERVMAIAQMLDGERPTSAALQNAREMVGIN